LDSLRRLFSTFAQGLPGAGLLLLRLAAGTSLLLHETSQLTLEEPLWQTATLVVRVCLSTLLVAGLGTPIVGTLTATLQLATAFWHPSDMWIHGLVASLGLALALLGPGAWSVDAWLFGWRRIEIPKRRSFPDRSTHPKR
jgi:putative oxidoreductase